ncbi:MAG: phospholipid scramblase-related protein [Ilumatobacteraceae bacterium]
MSTTPPAWHPDPAGRHQLRYWDGVAWTAHVSDNGVQGSDPLQPTGLDRVDDALTIGGQPDPAKIRAQVSGPGKYRSAGAAAAFAGGGTIFTEPILVVNQKAKLIELKNEYAVFDQAGTQIAGVLEVGQSKAKKALRLVSNLDQFMKHQLEITDASGRTVLRLTRPRKVLKSTVIVSDPSDVEVGRIIQDNVFGKIHFTLAANGQNVGSINAENWRAWNFRIEDASGSEIARITKTFEGFMKAAFTTADNYVVQIHGQIPQPLCSLVVGAALCVDTALKQDSR